MDCEQLKLEAIKRIKGDLEAEQPKKKKAVSAALLLKGLPTRMLVEALLLFPWFRVAVLHMSHALCCC